MRLKLEHRCTNFQSLMKDMSSYLLKSEFPTFASSSADTVAEPQSDVSNTQPLPAMVACHQQNTPSEGIGMREKLLTLWKGKQRDGTGGGEDDRPLKLLDLPIDILRAIVQEVRLHIANHPAYFCSQVHALYRFLIRMI